MGVPKFFRWLSERYPKVNQRLGRVPHPETIAEHFGDTMVEPSVRPDPLSECSTMPIIDRLYIDMNGIIHGCSHNNNTAEDDSEAISQITEAEIFRNMCYYLDRIVRDVAKPQQLVYMAVDGVAPRAKLNQQRSRRYRSGKEGQIEQTVYDAHLKKIEQQKNEEQSVDTEKLTGEETGEESSVWSYREEEEEEDEIRSDEDEGGVEEFEPGRFTGKFQALDDDECSTQSDDEQHLFHSNSITPGTPFFARCTAHLQHFLQRKVSDDPIWQKLTVILSGSNVPGEGEHKIMQFLRHQKTAYEQSQQRDKEDCEKSECDPLAYHPNLRHCIMGQVRDIELRVFLKK